MNKGDVVQLGNGILLSYKKEQKKAFCSNMDGPRHCHTKCNSKNENDKYHMISLICGIFKKEIQMNLFTKQK